MRKLLFEIVSNSRGQAMAEYALITWLGILVGLASIKMLPLMLRAFQTYFDNFYFVLTMPFP